VSSSCGVVVGELVEERDGQSGGAMNLLLDGRFVSCSFTGADPLEDEGA
jgi:hypothetical protein